MVKLSKLWPLAIMDAFCAKVDGLWELKDSLGWFAGARGGVETSMDDEEVVEKRRLAGQSAVTAVRAMK